MKTLLIIVAVALIGTFTSCDVQSGISKKSVEEYQPTATPSISPMPTEIPIDPADVVRVDTSIQGDTIQVNGPNEKKTVNCTKFNRVMVNGSGSVVTIKGACQQLMINGNRNDVTADAVADVVVNGSENNVKYSRFVNGKRPTVKESRAENVIEKIVVPAAGK